MSLEVKILKNFVTIFSNLKNIELNKDVGMIPYYISKISKNKIKGKLVSYKNDDYSNYNYDNEYLKFELINSSSRLLRNIYWPLLVYLFKNARSIDYLQLYHLNSRETLILSLIYKTFNKKGKLYIKLDADRNIYSVFEKRRNGWKKIFGNIRLVHFIPYIADYISVETKEIYDYLINTKLKSFKTKLFIIQNGLDIEAIKKYNIKRKSVEDKKDIIITVGRLGTRQKNTDLLLKSIKKIKNLKGWKIMLVGSVEESFKLEIKKFFEENQDLEDKVIFTGPIYDRKRLFELYNESKVFCLTSRWEGFVFVLLEALYFNNFLVSTDVGCSRDIIQDNKFGEVVSNEDEESLTSILERIINRQFFLEDKIKKIDDLEKNELSWELQVKKLLFFIGEKDSIDYQE
jgi:glycosyltransferase involved in cell wall biosynthesis